jgi:hypothetical protein
MEIVCVEILGCRRVAEKKVKKFEDQELEGGFRFPVQQKYQVATKCLVSHPMRRYRFDDSVRYPVSAITALGRGGYQVLLIENQLNLRQLNVDEACTLSLPEHE